MSDSEFDVVSTLTDRSILSDEMAEMCAKLPIYRIKKTQTQRKCLLSIPGLIFSLLQ